MSVGASTKACRRSANPGASVTKRTLGLCQRKPAFAAAVSHQIPIIYGLRSFGRSVAK
jgi:hypothetical protein